jgi:hypothetical protein
MGFKSTSFEEGLHLGIDADVYHAADAIGQSVLKGYKKSPAHGKAREDEESSKARHLELGDIIHKGILEPHNLDTYFSVNPYDGRKKEGKEFKEKHESMGIKVVSQKEADIIKGSVNAVRVHPDVAPWLKTGNAEVSAFARHKETGLMRKCRYDWLVDTNGPVDVCLDIKTTEDAQDFKRSVVNWGYAIQAASYIDIYQHLQGKPLRFIFVAVEKSSPFGVICYELDAAWLQRGREDYEDLLRVYAKCKKEQKWPCYPEGVRTIAKPEWA